MTLHSADARGPHHCDSEGNLVELIAGADTVRDA